MRCFPPQVLISLYVSSVYKKYCSVSIIYGEVVMYG